MQSAGKRSKSETKAKYKPLPKMDDSRQAKEELGDKSPLLEYMELPGKVESKTSATKTGGQKEKCKTDKLENDFSASKGTWQSTYDGTDDVESDLNTTTDEDIDEITGNVEKIGIKDNGGNGIEGKASNDNRKQDTDKTNVEENEEDDDVETIRIRTPKKGMNRHHSSGEIGLGRGERDEGANKIDIVRKMTMSSLVNHLPWQDLGAYAVLKQKSCQRVYAASGRKDDLALFYHNGRFYALEAWCSHMGGPLFEGDIEDYNGKCHVMCPWHSYMFDVATGKNELGLEQKVYDLKYENGHVFVQHTIALSCKPNRKTSHVVNFPPQKGKMTGDAQKAELDKVKRKTSVLETPFKL